MHLLADFVLFVTILAMKERLVVLVVMKQFLLFLLQLPNLRLDALAIRLIFHTQLHLVSGLALTNLLQTAVKFRPLCLIFA